VSGGLPFAAVSASTSAGGHTCGVTPAGSAYCWGPNSKGELGNGTTTDSPVPVAVSGGRSFASVSAGGGHTCGVTRAGAAYCWGWNGYGQLGDSTTTDSPVPVAVLGGLTFDSVSAGPYYTCGVTRAGAGYCWGWNNFAQLGIGNYTGPQICSALPCSTTPVAVSGGLTFASVSPGYWHTCGVTRAGEAYCWGINNVGQLGNDTATAYSTTPLVVSGGLVFAAVSTSPLHRACGVTPAGAAYCWGWNKDAQLGIGTTTGPQTCRTVACSMTPVAVSGGLTFAAVSAGSGHTCGVTPAGVAYCWGWNLSGELGNGTTTNSSVPVPVSQ
jgi:alpha-tubulin suppressor-like RCC1 family protein